MKRPGLAWLCWARPGCSWLGPAAFKARLGQAGLWAGLAGFLWLPCFCCAL